MSNVVPFVAKPDLSSQKALSYFIEWAKSQIHLYDLPDEPVQWESMSWYRWGLKQTACSKLGKKTEALSPGYIDYVKAMLFNERAVKLSDDHSSLCALRCLEVALLEITQEVDVTAVNFSVFDKACDLAKNYYSSAGTAYNVSRKLKYICDHLHEMGVVARPFIWDPQVKVPTPTLKKSEEAAKKKLPSDDALIALGEIFHSKPGLPLDIMTTSSVAIMLSQPSRIGELNYLKKDCFYSEFDSHGFEQLYMLWYSEKGYGSNRKLIPESMVETCREAVSRVIDITQEAREYAKWLEDNPEVFPYHEGVPNKDIDAPLTLKEACDALMISSRSISLRGLLKRYMQNIVASEVSSGRARKIARKILDGYDSSDGVRCYEKGKLIRYEFNDTYEISLRILNDLVREKYLPKSFPYTDNKRIVKWKDALFCFRTGAFSVVELNGMVKPFGITGCDRSRLSAQLTGSQKNMQSIFERHGYVGVSVNSHAFRHHLNTGAQRAGLSQELIARWSGRVDMSQNRVYNHILSEEQVVELETFTPQSLATGEKIKDSLKTNTPISMRDLGYDSDRIVHRTEFGLCMHDYAQEPCAKFNNCLTCGEHVCVKGDEVKLANLREEREYLRKSLMTFQKEAGEGAYGANTWLQVTMDKMDRCNQLIKVLESSNIQEGALIKGVDDRWSMGRNAMAMRGNDFNESFGLIEADSDVDELVELERILGVEE